MKRLFAQRRARAPRIAAILSVAALCAGCGHSAPTEFLTLQPVPAPALPASAGADPVRVVAVHVPAWLDRLQVARPTQGATVVVEDFQHWSAPVGDLMSAALTEDLTDRLAGTPRPGRACDGAIGDAGRVRRPVDARARRAA